MLSAASNAASAFQSAIMDTLSSKQNSDTEDSRSRETGETVQRSQNFQAEDSNIQSSANVSADSQQNSTARGASSPNHGLSALNNNNNNTETFIKITPPLNGNEILRQNNSTSDSPPSSWQERMSLSSATTNLDTTVAVATDMSGSPQNAASLTMEHFTSKDGQFNSPGTPMVPDTAANKEIQEGGNKGGGGGGGEGQITSDNLSNNDDRNGNRTRSPSQDSQNQRTFSLPRKSTLKMRKKKRSNNSTGNNEDASELSDFHQPPPIPGHSPARPQRNKEFHALFRSVPEEDYLIDDYSCALQKEILVQGRMYISVNHVCFNANIFGWVTNLVIAFTDIVAIEKRMTAFVIPNAILISTLHAKHFFPSFLARDTVHDLLTKLWRHSRPVPKPKPSLESFDGKSISNSSEGDASEESEPDEGKRKSKRNKKFVLPKLSLDPLKHILGDHSQEHENKDEEQKESVESDPDTQLNLEESVKGDSQQIHEKKYNQLKSKSTTESEPRPISDVANLSDSPIYSEVDVNPSHGRSPSKTRNAPKINANLKKRLRHPTQCACLKNQKHYNTIALDTKFTGSVEKIYNLLFTSGFIRRFLVEQEKCIDVNIGEWVSEPNKKLTRTSSYIKPLNNAIGPRSTKCYLKDQCLHRDFEIYVTNLTTTTTPDVPSGSSFSVKTRTCIMWAGVNEARVIVTCAVEFTKSSWLKGTIEKAALDGQIKYHKSLAHAIQKYIASHPTEFQDELRSPVRQPDENPLDDGAQEVEDEEEIRSRGISGESSEEDAKSIIDRAQTAGFSDALGELIGALYSIMTSLVENFSFPSTNSFLLFVLIFMGFANTYIWVRLMDISYKLEEIQKETRGTSGTRLGDWRPGDVLYESQKLREFSDIFDDRINSQGDLLWDWISQKAKKYEELKHQDTSSNIGSPPLSASFESSAQSKISSKNTQTKDSPNLDQGRPQDKYFGFFDHSFPNTKDNVRNGAAAAYRSNSRRFPPSSPPLNDIYWQIEDLQRLVQAAENHARKLVDIAEEQKYQEYKSMNKVVDKDEIEGVQKKGEL
ncbi:hypothetical protein G9A89_004348 [Geosiphon pyriformis]|nr:hypothetical protein G9A89_004348 [Geosiphon pyriformis]